MNSGLEFLIEKPSVCARPYLKYLHKHFLNLISYLLSFVCGKPLKKESLMFPLDFSYSLSLWILNQKVSNKIKIFFATYLHYFITTHFFNMANGDMPREYKYVTFAKCRVPLVGPLIDYMDSSIEYLWKRTFSRAEKFHMKSSGTRVSATFSALLCLILGFLANVKMEVVTFDEQPLPNDLHFVLMSKDDDIYIDDIDVSRKCS